MWDKIIETESGKEFDQWMWDVNSINWNPLAECWYMDHTRVVESIINNLAIEWLDSKGKRLTIGHYVNTYCYESYYYKINDKINSCKIENCGGFETRPEVIAAGVKKAFELLEGDS